MQSRHPEIGAPDDFPFTFIINCIDQLGKRSAFNAAPEGGEDFKSLMALAKKFLDQKKYQACVEIYDEAIQLNNLSELAFTGMAAAQTGLENYKLAITYINQASTIGKLLHADDQIIPYKNAITRLNEEINLYEANQKKALKIALLEEIFATGLWPMFIDKYKLCVLWTGKCGCTTLTKWVLHHLGLLEAANYCQYSPQEFRNLVLHKSKRFQSIVNDFSLIDDFHYCLITRNPYRRLLSSFCHLRVRRQLLNQGGFYNETVSFKEFSKVICQNLDINSSHHTHLQYSNLRKKLDDLVGIKKIKIENDLFKELIELEHTYNFTTKTSMEEQISLAHSDHHTTYIEDHNLVGSLANEPIDFNYDGSFSSPKCYFDEELFDLIYQCYEVDFVNCGYAHSEI